MQHISEFIGAAVISIPRQVAMCEFIQELRAAKGEFPFNAKSLETAGFAWDLVLAEIPVEALESRDAESLYVACAQAGYIEAPQVLAVWRAGKGAEQRLFDEALATSQSLAERLENAKSKGPGYQAFLEYLRQRGRTVAA